MRISDWSSDVCSSDLKAVGIDAADIAGRKPAVAECRLVDIEVLADDPMTAHQQLADGGAIVRQDLAVGINDLHLDAIWRTPLLGRQHTPGIGRPRLMLAQIGRAHV